MKKGIIDSEDDESNTPLHMACLRGHVDTAKVLLEAGADPNVRSVNDCQIRGPEHDSNVSQTEWEKSERV